MQCHLSSLKATVLAVIAPVYEKEMIQTYHLSRDPSLKLLGELGTDLEPVTKKESHNTCHVKTSLQLQQKETRSVAVAAMVFKSGFPHSHDTLNYLAFMQLLDSQELKERLIHMQLVPPANMCTGIITSAMAKLCQDMINSF